MSAQVLQIKNYILRNAVALGNSDREERHVCSDLLNSFIRGTRDLELAAEGTCLSESTIRRMMDLRESETGLPYNPSSDTCARILRYFGMEVKYTAGTIKEKYKNKPKTL